MVADGLLQVMVIQLLPLLPVWLLQAALVGAAVMSWLRHWTWVKVGLVP